jgi:MarR family transcriptional regulator, organic hydroperoxide resistance regulator
MGSSVIGMPTKKSAMLSKDEPVMLGNDELRLSSQLCFATYAASHAYSRFYKPVLDPHGLTYPQYLVLLVLWENDNLAVKEIGHRLYLDSGTLTPLLKRLEAAGIVKRSRDAQDERQVRITLTAKGRALKQPIADAYPKMVCGTGLDAEEFKALREQLNRMRESLNNFPD